MKPTWAAGLLLLLWLPFTSTALGAGVDARHFRGRVRRNASIDGNWSLGIEDNPNRGELDIYLLENFFGEGRLQNTNLDAWYKRLNDNLAGKGLSVAEGHSNNPSAARQRSSYNTLARTPGLKTVCETGFNAGHSALRFLAQSNAQLYEFDLGHHRYAKESAKFLQDSFPGRLTVIWGDSTKTLPAFHKSHPQVRCDVMIVDGGHTFEVASADLQNFASMASVQHTLVIDDTPCGIPGCCEWCVGPTKAWTKFKSSGCVTETKGMRMGSGARGFSMGRYNEGKC